MTKLNAIVVLAHFLPLSPAGYLALREGRKRIRPESDEWILCCTILGIFLSIVWDVTASDLSLVFSPTNFRAKYLFLAVTVVGLALVFITPGSPDRVKWYRMFRHHWLFSYGFVSVTAVYIWWGKGYMELCMWICLLSTVVLSSVMILAQTSDIVQLRAEEPSRKLVKRVRRRISCCLVRKAILTSVLVGAACFAALRLYFLSDLILG